MGTKQGFSTPAFCLKGDEDLAVVSAENAVKNMDKSVKCERGLV